MRSFPVPRLTLLRSWRAASAWLVAALLASCGGEPADITEAPTAFLGVVASSVPLASSPRVAASPDGSTTWLAWSEGDNARQSLVAARVNSVGIVDRMTVAPLAPGVIRDLQITMVGTTPVLTWRHFGDASDVTVNAASFRGLDWQMEIAALASAQGVDVKAVTLPSGRVSLAWTRLDGAGNFELVAARRSLDGSWSTPAVIRTGAAGTVLLRSGQSSDGAGGLMAIWSEAPGVGTAPPETLLSSQYDETLGAWGAALTVDSGRHYGDAAISSPADAEWVAAWLTGDAFGNTWLLSTRFAGGIWLSLGFVRVDRGEDAIIREMVLTSRNHHVHVGWTGLAAGADSGSVRSAAFDASAGAWSAPSLIGATPRGFPVGLRLAVEHGGTAAAVWSVSQGDGGPFLNKTDAAGTWQAAVQLDPDSTGVGADVSLFAPTDIATAWYRSVAGGRADVVVRRLR